MRRFFICALPRSRTAWLANFLTCGDSICYHSRLAIWGGDIEGHMSGMPIVGLADPLIAMTDHRFVHGHPLLIVKRDINDSLSASRFLGFDMAGIKKLNDAITKLEESEEHMSIPYQEIDSSLEEIWGYCVGRGFNRQRAEMLVGLNITEHIPHAVLQLKLHKENVTKFSKRMN